MVGGALERFVHMLWVAGGGLLGWVPKKQRAKSGSLPSSVAMSDL